MSFCGDLCSVRGMPNTTVYVGLAREVRQALLNDADLSSAAGAAIEHPFDTALTAPIAREVLAKCVRLGLAAAADILQIAVTALSSNSDEAHGDVRARHHERRVSSRQVAAEKGSPLRPSSYGVVPSTAPMSHPAPVRRLPR